MVRFRGLGRGAVVLLLAVAPAVGAAPAQAAGPGLGYTFSDGTDGFSAPAWLSANAGQPTRSSAQVAPGSSFSLALPVSMTGGGFDQAGADKVIDNFNPVDLSPYRAVQFSVFAPVPNISADLVFNDPWDPPTGLRNLSVGWNTITYDIGPTSADFPNQDFSQAKEFILRVVGRGVTYSGPIYFDAVQFVPTTSPVVRILAPQPDDTLAVPRGQTFALRARVSASPGRTIAGVTFQTAKLSGALTQDPATGEWTAPWDLWREGDGVVTAAVTATDSTGVSTTARTTVLVQDSQLTVRILQPTFDQQLSGRTRVVAQVHPDPRFGLPRMRLETGRESLPMELSGPDANGLLTASRSVETESLPDGAASLKVSATDRAFTVFDVADVLVQNRDEEWDVVRARGTSFVTGDDPLRYVGWNEYELFTRTDQTNQHVQTTADGTVLPKGAVRTWQQQIDRQMWEAASKGFTVLRTWAFDDNNETQAFQPAPGQYNEPTFQKLDYIVASAARHHMRVILTMVNYWPDYGGIGSYARWVGLPSKLLFYNSPAAQALYRAYVAHLVDRVNTVNGVPYRTDPTIFSWELMNEPRSDCADDPTPAKPFCDPTGVTVRNWIASASAYVKSLDPLHMVSAGGEAHGLVPVGRGQTFQWARTDEGDGNQPYFIQDVPTIDFLTNHPYPNASWAQFTFAQTRALIAGVTSLGVSLRKPVVEEEFGIDRTQAVTTPDGQVVPPADPRYLALRVQWYRLLLDQAYGHGAAGTNVWMLADWSDANLNVNLFLPQADVARDAPLVAAFAATAKRVSRGEREDG
jgi:Cellulase (glycosyl hydrolase family 5)